MKDQTAEKLIVQIGSNDMKQMAELRFRTPFLWSLS